jgi:hypothetical protein
MVYRAVFVQFFNPGGAGDLILHMNNRLPGPVLLSAFRCPFFGNQKVHHFQHFLLATGQA